MASGKNHNHSILLTSPVVAIVLDSQSLECFGCLIKSLLLLLPLAVSQRYSGSHIGEVHLISALCLLPSAFCLKSNCFVLHQIQKRYIIGSVEIGTGTPLGLVAGRNGIGDSRSSESLTKILELVKPKPVDSFANCI